jgi:type I restriction enzyme S subunit
MIFDDVLEIKNGRNQKNVENPNGKYPIYGSGGIMGYADDYICEADTVIIGRKGSINNPIYVEEPFWNVDTAFGLSAKREILMPRYLYYFCQYFDFERLNKAVTIPSLTKSDLLKIELELPTIENQKKIVDRLIKVEQIIQLKKRKLQKLDTLVKSRFVEMFGDPVANDKEWTTLPLEEACKTIVDCPHSTPSYTTENTGFMCIRTSIVKKNKILWDDIEYIPEDEFIKRIQRKKPEIGDVVYTREGAILGIAAIIDRECNVALGQRSMLLSPDANKCLSEFLCVAMNCDSFLDNALKGIAGSASPHINVGDIKSFKMIMPPIELQNQFADFVQQVDKSKSKIQKSLEETQLLFDSLMQKYFG